MTHEPDCVSPAFPEFMQAIRDKRVVCTARKYLINGDSFESSAQTFTLGEQWLTNQVSVTRVEFRIKREVLKDREINTMEDLQQYEQGLAHYCCHSWFRLLKKQKIKGHSHEQEVDPIWLEVQDAFAKWFPGVVDGENKSVKRLYVKPLQCSAKQYIQQAALWVSGTDTVPLVHHARLFL